MRSALQRAWLHRGALALLLWPLSLLYAALAGARRSLFRRGLLASERLPVPVVVVGNVVAGGAGKTPVVMALLAHLRAGGLAAGVVSRGHGRTATDCREVRPDSRPDEVGDEPLLVARRSGVPVFVARHRVEAARALLSAYPDTQVIVCDDGLQHLALARDIEICVFDERGTGNGWQLPAGPLREPWPRTVDFVLHHGEPRGIGGFSFRRQLAAYAVRADGARATLASLRDGRFHALAGIAKPESFFAMLRAAGLMLKSTEPLPDHYDFDSAPGPVDAGYPLICTEKDAVKLWRTRPDAWAVPLELELPEAFLRAFDLRLRPKLSSRHGSQTP